MSDKDVKFIGYLKKNHRRKLGTKIKFSTGFYPQINGHTELVNRSHGNLLWILLDEHMGSWDQKLFIDEFAYNTFINRTTSISPHEELLILGPNNLLISFLWFITIKDLSLHVYLHDMHDLHKKISLKVGKNANYNLQTDIKKRSRTSNVNDYVMVQIV